MTIQEILSGLAATNTNYAVELKEEGFPQPAKLADMIIMGPAKINYREILKEMMRQRSDFTRDKCVDILKKLLNIHSSRKVVKSSVDKDIVSRIIKEIDDYCNPRNRYLTNVSVDGYFENEISESEASIHIDEIRGCLYDLKDQLVALLNEEEWEGLSEDYWDAVNYCRDWLTREAYDDLYEDIFAPISRQINVKDTERGIMSNSVQSAKFEVDTDDLSEICIEDFFEPQGLDSVISILPVSDVTEDACLLIQDQLNRNGDFSNINVPEEVLAQAQVIFDSADYDSVVVNLSSENYLIFKLDNPSVKAEEDSDVKLVASEDTVVIETDDGDFLVKSKDSNFVEFIDEEMGDGIGDDEEMTEIVDGVSSSVKLVECDSEFIKNAGYKYCLVKSSKGPLLKNLMNNLDSSEPIKSSNQYIVKISSVSLDSTGSWDNARVRYYKGGRFDSKEPQYFSKERAEEIADDLKNDEQLKWGFGNEKHKVEVEEIKSSCK